MRTAVKLQITIPRHRRIQLPANVPEGKAEVILLYPDIATSSEDVSTAAPASTASGERRPGKARAAALRPGPSGRCPIDYFARLRARQPDPLSAEAARALDEADRGER